MKRSGYMDGSLNVKEEKGEEGEEEDDGEGRERKKEREGGT